MNQNIQEGIFPNESSNNCSEKEASSLLEEEFHLYILKNIKNLLNLLFFLKEVI